MYHPRNLSFVFCLDRNAVASVSHGNNGILQIIAGTSVYKRGELCMDPVSGNLHVSSNLAEVAACIITDLIFWEDASADLCCKRSQWFQCLEHPVQRVRERITALTSGISFDTIGVLKKAADGKKFTNPQRTSDFQTFQRTTHIFDAAKGNISFLEKTGKCISGLSLHMSDFINICGWLQLPADFFSHGRGSLVCQHIDDFIIFKCFICFLIHCLFKSPDRYLYNLLSLIL